jgi:hypothetical protein
MLQLKSTSVKSLLSIQSQSPLVVLTGYNSPFSNGSTFSSTGNEFDLLNSEILGHWKFFSVRDGFNQPFSKITFLFKEV